MDTSEYCRFLKEGRQKCVKTYYIHTYIFRRVNIANEIYILSLNYRKKASASSIAHNIHFLFLFFNWKIGGR